MCGISGYISEQKSVKKNILKKMCLSLHHRGPDSNGFYHTTDDNFNNLYLLHTRLNIIDVKERSNQPYRLGPFTLIFKSIKECFAN